MRNLLFVSILGEPGYYEPSQFTNVYPSGLEKDWIVAWYSKIAHDYDLHLSAVDICRGERMPDPLSVHAMILGGSTHIITEPRPWLDELQQWLGVYRTSKRPLLGICGGHQLMATAFASGDLRYRAGGTLAGTLPISLTTSGETNPFFFNIGADDRFHFANDLEIALPPASPATVLATDSGGGIAALAYGDDWYSCQFHPESQRAIWNAFYADRPQHLKNYRDAHSGLKLLKNFLDASRLAHL